MVFFDSFFSTIALLFKKLIMLPRERQIEIVRIVNRKGTVKTTELAEQLHCTEETIRRDLDFLEKEKKVVRSHGGAMSIQDTYEELQHHKRESREVAEKKMIGYVAASYIKEGETIFIDESSTALAMIEYLPLDIKFNLFTNSLLVAKRVTSKKNINLYLLGGAYDETCFSFGGYLAEESMKQVSVDRFFFSCKGLDQYFGASEVNEERARLKKSLLKSASWKCALADHTKLGLKARFSFMLPQQIDLVITDEGACAESISSFNKAGVKVDIKS